MSFIDSFLHRFNIVKQIPIFSNLNWFDMQRIARKAVIEHYKKGDLIRHEGDPADFFYCLISGRIRTYKTDSTGRKENVEFIHRGVHFGIISLLTGENHTLTYEAVNNSIVLKIDKDEFHTILKSIPQLSIDLNHSLSKRVRGHVKGVKTIFESTIISVYSPILATGSSTYAVNLAINLAKETKKKVMLININTTDYDFSKIPTNETTPHWKKSPVLLDDIIAEHDKINENISKDPTGIDVLNFSFDTNGTALKEDVSQLISPLVMDYHYVIFDLPNTMDAVVQETLTQSDQVHLITTDQQEDLAVTRKIIDRLEQTLKDNFKEERIKVIIRAVNQKEYLSFEEINKYIDFSVYVSLPLIPKEDLTQKIDTDNFDFLMSHDKTVYAKTMRRIAREVGGVLVGLVLGGGAALGIAHIGVIRVLEEEGIPIDYVVGSSMGALIGGLWASGMTIDELEGAAREFENKMFMLKLFDPVIPIKGLIGGRLIGRWLKKYLGNKTFYNVRVPFKVVAYDLLKREELVIDTGLIVDGIRKSIAIPGVIEPICENGQEIIDGGVLNPLPTNVLYSRGIRKIIAVNVLQSPSDVVAGVEMINKHKKALADIPFRKKPFHYVKFRIGRMFGRSISPNISDIIVRTLQACEHVIAEQSAQHADVVIHPDTAGINWFELYKVDELLKAGEVATRQKLAEIKHLIEQH
ncbi:MAG: cyclic nucleotide-binding domain-containing protein [Candidatus Omnitrophica bacterium]|nr:cyclic nucleotide-binding domain-containing protein [Candidatus Omnitrophota bacterium]